LFEGTQTVRLEAEITNDEDTCAFFNANVLAFWFTDARGTRRLHLYMKGDRCYQHTDRDDKTFSRLLADGTRVEYNCACKGFTNPCPFTITLTLYWRPLSCKTVVHLRIPPRATMIVRGELLRGAPVMVAFGGGRAVPICASHGCDRVESEYRVLVQSILFSWPRPEAQPHLWLPAMDGFVDGKLVHSMAACPMTATDGAAAASSASSSSAASSAGSSSAAAATAALGADALRLCYTAGASAVPSAASSDEISSNGANLPVDSPADGSGAGAAAAAADFSSRAGVDRLVRLAAGRPVDAVTLHRLARCA